MASPGTISRTKAVDVSIHEVMPVSVATSETAWAVPGWNNDEPNRNKIVVKILLLIKIDYVKLMRPKKLTISTYM